MKKHEALKYVLHHFILNILAFSLFISVFLGLAAIVRFSEVTIPTYIYVHHPPYINISMSHPLALDRR